VLLICIGGSLALPCIVSESYDKLKNLDFYKHTVSIRNNRSTFCSIHRILVTRQGSYLYFTTIRQTRQNTENSKITAWALSFRVQIALSYYRIVGSSRLHDCPYLEAVIELVYVRVFALKLGTSIIFRDWITVLKN
jgi:hypothetical protein